MAIHGRRRLDTGTFTKNADGSVNISLQVTGLNLAYV